MGLIEKHRQALKTAARFLKVFIIVLFFLEMFLWRTEALGAQSTYLAYEIEKLEELAQTQGQKHEALIRLARLHQLSGDKEKALRFWTLAAYAEPGKNDDEALLEAIKLLISIGEYDKADADLSTLLSSQDEKIQETAIFLSAQIHAFKTGDGDPLRQFIENPKYKGVQSSLFYTLWKTTEDSIWKTRLLNTYPRSPEAEIARESTGIIAAATPQWLLFPPRESLDSTAPVQDLAAQPPAPPISIVPAPVLQTGLFSQEGNARAMVDQLTKAGFQSEISRRTVNGTEYWAVHVTIGTDVDQTKRELKDAGFESFIIK